MYQDVPSYHSRTMVGAKREDKRRLPVYLHFLTGYDSPFISRAATTVTALLQLWLYWTMGKQVDMWPKVSNFFDKGWEPKVSVTVSQVIVCHAVMSCYHNGTVISCCRAIILNLFKQWLMLILGTCWKTFVFKTRLKSDCLSYVIPGMSNAYFDPSLGHT